MNINNAISDGRLRVQEEMVIKKARMNQNRVGMLLFVVVKAGDWDGSLYIGANWFWRHHSYRTFATDCGAAKVDERSFCREVSLGIQKRQRRSEIRDGAKDWKKV